jgi:hypothetical protein
VNSTKNPGLQARARFFFLAGRKQSAASGKKYRATQVLHGGLKVAREFPPARWEKIPSDFYFHRARDRAVDRVKTRILAHIGRNFHRRIPGTKKPAIS